MQDDKEFYSEEESDALFEHYTFKADPGQQLLRIDKYLQDKLPNTSRNKIQLSIRDNFVTVNEKPVKANYKVHPDDTISVSFPEPPRNEEVTPEDIPLTIVYEDDHVLVVNKEAGMVVHPAHQNWSGTLVNALVHHFDRLPTHRNGIIRPGLVHRIDKDTSGLLVIAKTDEAMTSLAKQFFDHSVERTYHALVWGMPDEEEGTIDINLGRHPKDRRITTTFDDGETGKRAITHYKVLQHYHYVSLIECQLETGRTHQIRAHMKYLGHPLFNDAMYGGNRIMAGQVFGKYRQFVNNTFQVLPRQALHAKTLGFIHPGNNENMRFESALPEDMQEAINRWEKYANYHD